MTQLRPGSGAAPTGEAAIAAFVDDLATKRQPSGYRTSANTLRNYRLAVEAVLDLAAPVSELDDDQAAARLRAAIRERWSSKAASTWNVKLAALRAFVTFARDRGWIHGNPLDGIERAPEPKSESRARPRAAIDRLIHDHRRHSLRDRTLWALLYSTFARVEELLALDVEKLDLRNRQATVKRKGGAPDLVSWDVPTARLLARLVGDRTRGPVFLTSRAAKGASKGTVNAADLDPETDRGRLGYDQALKNLRDATSGWTPHDLRHSGMTHASEDGVDVTILMVKSGHQDIRSLARYTRPSVEAAQRIVDNARRH
ncbi:tyrosine-type recombinase/integrase [Saccharopolyspora shandongensis]|uniref:tyrosine-type recombinase/integrase n=1 Tax=Saccharopolyspora shandongensis TaxID=418495 RepID=UPI0033C8EF36